MDSAYDAYMNGDDILPQYLNDAPFEEKEEDLPAEARQVPRPVRRQIRNAHRNLGHPSNESLARLMQIANSDLCKTFEV